MNYLTREYIINPIIADDFKLFRGPNPYSILMMSFGYQFITESNFTKYSREEVPQGPESNLNQDGRPFRFSMFSRF